ncbi:MAG: hypothetical protein BWX76_00248 [Candidatus Cloacimonetes bacterium ADurb.Bin089]|nr:MAG: hypothetical protein BWX76_00248 [Candidatus Cloacimonetes bacterium ADurb.Bin089]
MYSQLNSVLFFLLLDEQCSCSLVCYQPIWCLLPSVNLQANPYLTEDILIV